MKNILINLICRITYLVYFWYNKRDIKAIKRAIKICKWLKFKDCAHSIKALTETLNSLKEQRAQIEKEYNEIFKGK